MKEERRSSTDRLYGSFDGNVFGSFSSLGDDVGDSEFQFVFRSTLISSLFTVNTLCRFFYYRYDTITR
uniref:Uncharacterized protein n=1 Tax=Helianthus annuus TaxID=4232 RepID=A0A251SG55_HELAN